MSTDTSSLFQMVHERDRQRGLGNLLRGELAREFARWFKTRKGRPQILIWLLIVNLILFFTTTGLRQVSKAAAAAGGAPPRVGTVLLYGVFVGMLVAFGVMIIARRGIVGARRATTLGMQGKLDAGKEPIDPNTEAVLRSRIMLAQASLECAARLLQRPLEAVETGERFGSAIELLSLQALAFQARGEPLQANAALERARALAEPERTAPSKTQASQQALVEPLSERELEILELVAEGLTNREIASRLYLATNTVKAHTGSIYGKLDVHNRTQAAARARTLGLLPYCTQEIGMERTRENDYKR